MYNNRNRFGNSIQKKPNYKYTLNNWVWLFCLGVTSLGAMPLQFSPLESESRGAGLTFTNDAHYLTLDLLEDEDRYYTQGLHLFSVSAPKSITKAWGPIGYLGKLLDAPWVRSPLFDHGFGTVLLAWSW